MPHLFRRQSCRVIFRTCLLSILTVGLQGSLIAQEPEDDHGHDHGHGHGHDHDHDHGHGHGHGDGDGREHSHVHHGVAHPDVSRFDVLYPLPPGSVKPTGWLGDWATTQANGMVRDLANRHPVFQQGWMEQQVMIKNKQGEKVLARGNNFGWPLEQSAYWIDGLIRLGHIMGDEELVGLGAQRLDHVIANASDNPRDLMVYFGPSGNNKRLNNFQQWSVGVLARAMIAHYQATGDEKYLHELERVYLGYKKKTDS